MDLRGRVALVTGACGGIGVAISGALCELGCDLVLLDRSLHDLTSLGAKLHAEREIRTCAIQADLEKESDRIVAVERVHAEFGRLDVLVNNAAFVGDAGLPGWAVPFDEQDLSTWRRALEVNLTACFHLSQILAPLLREHRTGSIINIGSIYGAVGPDLDLYAGTSMGNPAAYAASKGGLIQLTRWLATTMAPAVRVNCICPGGVFRNQPASFVEKYERRTPLARMASEEDFKGAVAYLASDLSAYVSGHSLFVDGGWTSW